MNIFEQQATFMEACGQSTTAENPDQFDMYSTLIVEETDELNEAIDNDDVVEIADALVDILVVTIGAGLSIGLPMQALWDEVMRSNMAKIGSDGKVTRRDDGKILKPAGWTPPDIATVLAAHGFEVDVPED